MKNLSVSVPVIASLVLLAGLPNPAEAACGLDTGFNPGGSFSSGSTVLAVVVQSDGKVVLGGSFVYNGNYPNGYPYSATNLVRFNSNGTVDTGYNPAPNGIVYALALQPDGKIIAGGSFTKVSNMNQMFISRLTTSGYPDYIGFQAPAPNHYVLALGLQSDGKVIIGGAFWTVANNTYSRLARLNTTGTLDTTFNPGVSGGSMPMVRALAVHAAGTPSADKILVGGEFTALGAYARVNLGRLNANGSVDSGFSLGATVPNAAVYTVAADYGPFGPSGVNGPNVEKVLYGGAFTGAGGGRPYFNRVNADGSAESNAGNLVDGTVKTIRIFPDHSILLGGSFTHSQSSARNGVARIMPGQASDSLAVDGTWPDCSPNGAGGGIVESAAIGSATTVYIGGTFTTFEGAARPKVARLVLP